MPLPPSTATTRQELHVRRIHLQGFRRDDGLYDIEARLVDIKTERITLSSGRSVVPDEPVHDMAVRLVVDADLVVHDVQACTDAAPHAICPEAPRTLACILGLRIGPGWSRAIAERLSGRQGCTHLTELLKPLATVAFQTLAPARQQQPTALDAQGRPRKIDSCYAYAADREVVQGLWPVHFTGQRGGS
jgi:hypothetical protein